MESIGATQQGPDVLVSLFSIASAAGRLACGSVPDHFLQTRHIPRQASRSLVFGCLVTVQDIKGFRAVQHQTPETCWPPALQILKGKRDGLSNNKHTSSRPSPVDTRLWTVAARQSRVTAGRWSLSPCLSLKPPWLCTQDAVPHRCGRADRSWSGAGQHVQGGAAVGRSPGGRLCVRLPLEPDAAPGWRGDAHQDVLLDALAN